MRSRETARNEASGFSGPSALHDASGGACPVIVWRETDVDEWGGSLSAHLLGVIRYGESPEPGRAANPAECSIPLRCLDPSSAVFTWLGGRAANSGQCGGVTYRCDGETLLGIYRDGHTTPETIEESAYSAYLAMLDVATSAGYPYVYRIWNYLPEINREMGGMEVYKAFCIGRQRAFDCRRAPADAAVPAACAIGTRVPGFCLYFVASRHAVQPLSNPRQIEAYHYPLQYGPKSPAFSRAVLVRHGTAAQLHISGTASIVGHASRHIGDIDAQLTETLTNLETLLRRVGLGYPDLGGNALFTIYLRRETDLQRVKKRLSSVLAPDVIRVFLQGDICRSSLLLEIEGIISIDTSTPPDLSKPTRN